MSCLHVSGQNHLHEVTKESEDLIRIREVASVHAKPDTAYLLMRVESGSVSLTQAIQDNERQISSFLEGLDGSYSSPARTWDPDVEPNADPGYAGLSGTSHPDGMKRVMLTKCTQCHQSIHGTDLPSQGIPGQGRALNR